MIRLSLFFVVLFSLISGGTFAQFEDESMDTDVSVVSFQFLLDVETLESQGTFNEFSGIELEEGLMDFREEDEGFSTQKMTGLESAGTITLMNGIIDNDDFMKWYSSKKLYDFPRQKVVITQVDAEGNVVNTWVLENARPVKVSLGDGVGEDLQIDSIEFSYETITSD
jgi:phage tail-like protein